MTSSSIDLPPIARDQSLVVRFCYALMLESQDSAWFQIEQLGDFPLTPTSSWSTIEFDLTDLAGERITFNWGFRSNGKTPSEDIGGLWVDEVHIELHAICPEPIGGGLDFDDGLEGFLRAWGACDGCPEDLNGDGVVDHADLLILLSRLAAID